MEILTRIFENHGQAGAVLVVLALAGIWLWDWRKDRKAQNHFSQTGNMVEDSEARRKGRE